MSDVINDSLLASWKDYVRNHYSDDPKYRPFEDDFDWVEEDEDYGDIESSYLYITYSKRDFTLECVEGPMSSDYYRGAGSEVWVANVTIGKDTTVGDLLDSDDAIPDEAFENYAPNGVKESDFDAIIKLIGDLDWEIGIDRYHGQTVRVTTDCEAPLKQLRVALKLLGWESDLTKRDHWNLGDPYLSIDIDVDWDFWDLTYLRRLFADFDGTELQKFVEAWK